MRFSLAALALLAAMPAGAQNLTVGFAAPVTSLDPHFQNAAPNNAVAMHVFDRLVERDAQSNLVPGLATEWRPEGESAWSFRLREGVAFHDGTPFGAEDVAFTVARIRTMPAGVGAFQICIRNVTAMELPGDGRVVLRTPGPAPYLLSDLASLHILSRRVGEGAATADYDTGRAVIGTGPYRLTGFRTGERVDLTRHEAAGTRARIGEPSRSG
jgi:peptide/nickel transport system substrate-binding protein